ncbi:MAG TPA: BatA and WFA domain-containing protein [Candidatus Nanoarchaeia archaeon]|nr:BatA and WFA domain-containing protein [Candidatus Nanoarchaeia archaeon]
MVFSNIAGLYALLAIVPFVIIYLIRPKTFERVIPSLMFIMKERNKLIKASFLQRVLMNLLFFLQLAIIIMLAIAAASPYLEIPHSIMVRNSVIVLDDSASMQAKDGMETRFEQAVGKAKDNLGLKNTIILAQSTPAIVLEHGSSGNALNLLNRIVPKATTTNIGDAMLMAGDMLGDKKGVITVISDFIQTEGSDILIAKRELASRGHSVNLIDVNSKAENIGITDIFVDKKETIIEIKNYKDSDEKIRVSLSKDGRKVDSRELSLLAKSKEKVLFETLGGLSELTLEVNDDFLVDNKAFVSSPEKKAFRILLIANNPDESKIKSALSVIGAELEVREPPTVNAYNIDHDIVVIGEIKKDLFVPTDFTDLKKYVDKGGKLIISAQEDLGEINMAGLLPINVKSKEDRQTSICADIIGNLFPKDPFSDEPCFNSASKYISAEAQNGTLVMASNKEDGSPAIVVKRQGNGEVIYYGIIDKYSGFYSDPFYPIFWNNLVNYLMKTENIKDFNYKTGKIVSAASPEIKTPSSRISASRLVLDETGIYEVDGKKIAVNLGDEKESDINKETLQLKSALGEISEEKVKDTSNLDLEVPLLIAGVLLLFLEFLYIKRRGDL